MRNFVAVMRARIILILLLAMLTPSVLSAESMVVDTLPGRMAWASARIRMQAPRMGAADWVATLGDTSEYMRVRVHMPPRDEIYGRRCAAVAFGCAGGTERELGRAEFDCSADEASVRIVYDGYSARIYTGDVANVLVCKVDSLCPGPISVDGDCVVVEAWARFLPLPEPEMSAFATIDSLLAYLSASEDQYEGLWRYLDRDMDASRTDLGAYYDLATVRRADGGYDIIYLGYSGANEMGVARHWRPLQIKGRLAPTIFIGNFDLAWREASGVDVGAEANAQFAPDASILALRFPLLRAQLRFSRALPAR